MITPHPQGRKIQIMIVEDHATVRKGIAAILSAALDFEIVAETESGENSVRLYENHRPDVVLMDIRLSGAMDGIDAISAICGSWPTARILVLTTYGDGETMHRALEVGAKGYFIKDTLDERLFDAIRVVHRGGNYLPVEVDAKPAEFTATVGLTTDENNVLVLMARGHDNDQIRAEIGISEEGVRALVEHAFVKLGVNSRPEAVVIAIQRGFISFV